MAMSASEFNRRMREAQRKAERELDRVNRANKKAVGDYAVASKVSYEPILKENA